MADNKEKNKKNRGKKDPGVSQRGEQRSARIKKSPDSPDAADKKKKPAPDTPGGKKRSSDSRTVSGRPGKRSVSKSAKKAQSKTAKVARSADKKIPSTVKKAAGKKSTPETVSKKKPAGAKPPAKKSADKKYRKTVSPRTKKGIAKKKETLPVRKEEIDPYELEAIERGDTPMTVVEHLEEFRYRLLISLSAIVIVAIAAFFISEQILGFITEPFRRSGHMLNIFELAGGFFIKLKASAITALIVTMPLLVFHFWRYISPAISLNERTVSRRVVFAGVLLFYTGVAFVFFAIVPFSVNILLSLIDSNMHTTIGADDYLNFIFMFCLAMGIVFELPIIVMLLTRAGLISPLFLSGKRKYAIVIIWIGSAMITPPDVISQIIIAIPVMALYEISIKISKQVLIRKKRLESGVFR